MEKAAIDVITSRWGFAGTQMKRGKNLLTEKAPTMAVKKERKEGLSKWSKIEKNVHDDK